LALGAGDGQEETFVAYSAFRTRAEDLRPGSSSAAAVAEEAAAALDGVTLRAAYDLTGFRAEADLMLWLVAGEATALQAALRGFAGTELGAALDLWWTAIGVHRPAEFNKQHVPAFLEGRPPKGFVCVYPYTRTKEWYLLPGEDRSRLLAEHGRMGREYPGVQANTVSAFGFGDYEWLLAFEADELAEITELMRHLRGAGARAYTAAETPFLTGSRASLGELVARRMPGAAAAEIPIEAHSLASGDRRR
jgi:chlorite dismutase